MEVGRARDIDVDRFESPLEAGLDGPDLERRADDLT